MNILGVVTACLVAATASPEASAEHNLFNGAVEVRHYTFDDDQDRDFDGQPDDWTRRKGPQFPAYVKTGVDRRHGYKSNQSLRFDVNGGEVVTYSPTTRIDALHSYVFQGYIRTQLLKHDAALISVSLLNHKRERVQRFLSRPVTGTHKDWQRVEIQPIVPHPDVRFVVIGCHLVHGQKMDIRGQVWFDGLWLGMLPQLSLVSNYYTHFKEKSAPIEIESRVSGLDPERTYRLRMRMIDSSDRVLEDTDMPLEAAVVDPNRDPDDPLPVNKPIVWPLPPQNYGFYRVKSALERDGEVILEKQTTFAVMDLIDSLPRRYGEFGWSISRTVAPQVLTELSDIAAQSGINWVKYPLWKSVYDKDQNVPAEIARLFDKFNHKHIEPIGLLNDPPAELRNKFAQNWTGFSEIFTMPPRFWSPSLESVIARYSSQVRYWQLGTETDLSFVGLSRLPQTLKTVKTEFDRIGRDTHIGLHWDWNSPLPRNADFGQGYLSIDSRPQLDEQQLRQKLSDASKAAMPIWVLLKPRKTGTEEYSTSDAGEMSRLEDQASDFVKRMVASKTNGAKLIFATDIFNEDFGLLNPNGSPSEFFLPWRTTALALQGSEFLGSINLPGKSRNYLFARDGEVTLFVWNDEPTVERIYLGENTQMTDIWGRVIPNRIDGTEREQVIDVGPAPLIIRHCSEPIVRWRMAVQFQNGRIRSEHGGQQESILGRNTFPQGVSGTVKLIMPRKPDQEFEHWEAEPNSWQIQVATGEKFELPMLLTLPANASLGAEELIIDFDIAADRPYKIRVHRPYQVGMGDIQIEVKDRKLPDGRLELEQIITNGTSPVEILNFRCSLFAPGNKRQKQFVTKLGTGEDHKFYYLPDADELRGKKLWMRAEQVGGARVLNYHWIAGQNWDTVPTEEIGMPPGGPGSPATPPQ